MAQTVGIGVKDMGNVPTITFINSDTIITPFNLSQYIGLNFNSTRLSRLFTLIIKMYHYT